MNSNEIYVAIERIASTASKNEKELLVKQFSAFPSFVRVLEYAYNPFKTYGIVPESPRDKWAQRGDEAEFDDKTWKILDALIARSLTGAAARSAIETEFKRLTEDSAELLYRIVKKDLRAGFSESTCNKAVKGLIPDFPYMRCSLTKDVDLATWPWEDGVFSQEKADGMFANVDHEYGGLVRITSRQGSEFPIEKFETLANEVRARLAEGCQNHGEIVVLRDGVVCERQTGNGILNSVLSGGDFAENEKPMYFVWDQIPLTAVVTKGRHKVAYRQRITGVIKQLKAAPGSSIALIPTKIVRSLSDALTHYRELLASGKEGTVIKHPEAIWRDGTSKEQVKLKLEVDVDLKIVGIVPGSPGTKTEGRAGSFTCVTSCGQLQVNVAVKNEKLRDRVDANPSDYIDRIIVVRANSILFPSESNEFHSLFLPRMAEGDYRVDKTEPDSLQRVRDQFESAVRAA
jgi:DNA ligase-1